MEERKRRTVSSPEELYENAYRNSSKSEGVKRQKINRKKEVARAKAVLILASAVLITASIGAYRLIDKGIETAQIRTGIRDFYSQAEYYDGEKSYYQVINGTMWDGMNEHGHVVGFNQTDLASFVEKSENKDVTLFSIFNRISQNTIWNMNEVISRTNWGEGERYKDFNDYLTKKGFVDKKGEPSIEKYKEVMTERVLAEKSIKDTETNYGIK